MNFWIIYLFIFIILSKDVEFCKAQGTSDNTPPVIWLDRNWRIPSIEPVGSVVTRVRADDNEHDALQFGLEPLDRPGMPAPKGNLPFRIDQTTGVVYTNRSLTDMIGQNMFLYVTVSDGKLTAKTEVWVNIVNGSNPAAYATGGNAPGRLRPPFLQLPNFGARQPPPRIPPPPPISTQQNISPIFNQPQSTQTPLSGSNRTQEKTYLSPILPSEVSNNIELVSSTTTRSNLLTSTESPEVKSDAGGNELNSNISLPPADLPVSSKPDIAVTIVPVLSVCAVFFAVGIIALLFKKKIYLARTKSSKDDIRKESNGGIVLQEDPSITMRQWGGPRAFSNRYESWQQRDNLTHQDSVIGDIKNGDIPRDQWEFPRHRLKVFNILGEGAFGQVWKCEALDIDGKDGVTVVAVKTLKENAGEKERSDLTSELQVMKSLEPHPNVVRLLGCCTQDSGPLFVIMEYVARGKLQSYLRNSRAERHYGNVHGHSSCLTSRDLTSFVYQVARGMDYLSSKGIIHRDLAARNVLINDEHVCKVADFGFARDVTNTALVYERKSEGRLPIRWMAPESLYDNIFSIKSDVWSFGVLIWEVVTLGSTPYPGLSAADVMKKVRDGHRLEKPEHCRRELYNIMYYCWDQNPKERPTFEECVSMLEKLLTTETDYIELEHFPDHSYYNVLSLSGEKL